MVTKNRLPIFKTDQMEAVLCRALDEVRKSEGFLLFAYVIMIDHIGSLWQTEKNVLPIFSEGMFMEKVNYIHQNPVRAGLVDHATDYRWSSARIWQGGPLEDEPLLVDKDLINWRPGRSRNPHCCGPPPQIRTCGVTASGSCLGSDGQPAASTRRERDASRAKGYG